MLAASLLAAATQAEPPSEKDNTLQVRRAIESLNARYLDYAKQGSAAGLASLYNEEGTLLQVSGKIIRGRKAIGRFMEAQFKELGTLIQGTLATRDVFVLGGIAYETGSYRLTYGREGQPGPTLEGSYVHVWKLQPTGAWKIYRDVNQPKE